MSAALMTGGSSEFKHRLDTDFGYADAALGHSLQIELRSIIHSIREQLNMADIQREESIKVVLGILDISGLLIILSVVDNTAFQ